MGIARWDALKMLVRPFEAHWTINAEAGHSV